MPVIVQDYTWRETLNEVVITIPLKGVKPSKADIFSSDDYVKVCVHSPPLHCSTITFYKIDAFTDVL